VEVIRCAVMTTMRFSGDLLSSCFDVVVVANARKKTPSGGGLSARSCRVACARASAGVHCFQANASLVTGCQRRISRHAL